MSRGRHTPEPDPVDVKQRWLTQALANAHTDASRWIPSKGARANRPIIEAVYGYYAHLYLRDERFRWAGMASLVGPSFAAGFLDIDAVPGHLLGFSTPCFWRCNVKSLRTRPSCMRHT